jgi:hypothetical protein
MSTKPASGKNSATTMPAREKADAIGRALTATGSGERLTLPRPDHKHARTDPKQELMPLLRPIVDDETASLLSWLNYGEKNLEPHQIPRALELLDRLDVDIGVWSRPSESVEILDILEMMANIIQVDQPVDAGLKAYVSLLQVLPSHVLSASAMRILRTHTYRTMPLPAEFLQGPEAREWQAIVDYIPQQIARHRARLLKLTR